MNDITCRSRIINILGSTEPVGIVEVGTNGIVTVKMEVNCAFCISVQLGTIILAKDEAP